ncbi:MAG: M48 family metallopeptidase, partial [Actinomycetota bacterium]
WLSDRLRSTALGAVVAGISAVAFFAVVRAAPRSWWLWGWPAFSALTALMAFLWPVLIAPLFNRFEVLEDEALARRALALSREAGVAVDRVLVADASRRTTTENAYVAGFGATKRLVLYDTLVKAGDDDETLFVVGHELGHRAEGHIWKSLALSSLGLLAGFAALAWLVSRGPLLSWAGASSLADLRVIPALLLFATLAGIVVLPFETAMSRRFEGRADEVAIELTGDADTAVRTFRRLALNNLADLRPPDPAVWLLFTHPPTRERIGAVLTARRASEP